MLSCLSFNLRVDVPADGEYRFLNRQERLGQFLKDKAADVYLFQEVTPLMASWLQSCLQGYEMIVTYRNKEDEGVPIFYRLDRLSILDQGTFWLSDTPMEISKYPESHFYRIMTYALFEDRNGREFICINTHLDYASDQIACAQAKVILSQTGQLRQKYPIVGIVLAGDFNQPRNSTTIRSVEDVFEMATDGITETFHGFGTMNPGAAIDYIFVLNLASYSSRTIQLGQPWLSDHHPLEIELY